jgi:hypothetical protein
MSLLKSHLRTTMEELGEPLVLEEELAAAVAVDELAIDCDLLDAGHCSQLC